MTSPSDGPINPHELTYPELLELQQAIEGEIFDRRCQYTSRRDQGCTLLRRDVVSWPTRTLEREIDRIESRIAPLYRIVAGEWLRRHVDAAENLHLSPGERARIEKSELPEGRDLYDPYFGACPHCLTAGRMVTVGGIDWVACEGCRSRWEFGHGFGDATSGEQRERNEQFLRSCEEVECARFELIRVDADEVRAALEKERAREPDLPF